MEGRGAEVLAWFYVGVKILALMAIAAYAILEALRYRRKIIEERRGGGRPREPKEDGKGKGDGTGSPGPEDGNG